MSPQMKTLVQKTVTFVSKNQRHLSSAALVGGFIFDTITLQRIDLLFEQLVLYTHLLIAGTSILLIHALMSREIRGIIANRFLVFLPIVTQFSFGALFSAFLIFYSRSGELVSSWPFLFIILLIIVLNELLRSYQIRLTFQLSIFFLALFSFAIFSVPIVVGSIGFWIFILSGLITVIVFSVFILLLMIIGKERFRKSKRLTVISTTLIFVLINVLYVSNILPPIPLSMKEVNVYHSVERLGNEYLALAEERLLYSFLLGDKKMHLVEGGSLSVFSSVFAPTDIQTEIVHVWQYYNQKEGKWETSSTILFPIVGGRDGGFRGFSEKEKLFPGKWRVDIKTTRNQLIGRVKFKIERAEATPALNKKML